MRSIVFAFALFSSLAGTSCASPTDGDDDDPLESTESAATSCPARNERTVKIVSANIFEGGVWSDANRGERNWATMEKFVSLVTDIDAKVLAVQETVSGESVNRLEQRLNAVSGPGKTWAKQDTVTAQPWGIVTAIYWRTDAIDLVTSLGHKDLGKLDSNGYTIRFHGALLARKGTGEQLGVFTGKLPWTNDDENFRMAPVLRDWVRDVMAPYPNAVRVLGMDMNADLGTRTWKLFNADYDDSGATLRTHPSNGWFALRKRLDYLWVDRDNGPRQGCAFTEPVRRSMHFGSDHRFVWSDVYVH